MKFKLAVAENERRKLQEEQALVRRRQREEQLAVKKRLRKLYNTIHTYTHIYIVVIGGFSEERGLHTPLMSATDTFLVRVFRSFHLSKILKTILKYAFVMYVFYEILF